MHSTLLLAPNLDGEMRNYFLDPYRVSRGREASWEFKSKQVLNESIVNDQSKSLTFPYIPNIHYFTNSIFQIIHLKEKKLKLDFIMLVKVTNNVS